MASNSEQNSSQEIDLSYLTKKMSQFFDSIGFAIYKFFKFILKNIIVVSVVIILGIIAGYFLDQKQKDTYKHEIIVVPNFNSSTYLYNKIENIDLKGSSISSIELAPILNIYEFITEDWNNLEIAKYLSQNNIQIDKYSPNSDVEKLYRYHLMTITTKRFDKGGEIVDSLLNEFNKDPYYVERQKIEIKNNQDLIIGLEDNVAKIDRILEKIGSTTIASGDLNIEMYSELNNLISSKRAALLEINKKQILHLEESKVIFPTSKSLNIKVKTFPKIVLLPLLFFGMFLFVHVLIGFFKKYKKIESNR